MPRQVKASSCAVLSSAVSSRMLSALARAEGLVWEETLTGECVVLSMGHRRPLDAYFFAGFKWLGSRAIELEGKEGKTVGCLCICYRRAL